MGAIMNYVRTKDGIYERSKVSIVNENGIEIVLPYIDAEFVERTRGKFWNCGTNVIIKQANSIEELCDAFVKKSKEQGNNYFNVGTDVNVVFDRKYGKADLAHYHYYGAIFTEQGLIFVAELNEKEVLKLR